MTIRLTKPKDYLIKVKSSLLGLFDFIRSDIKLSALYGSLICALLFTYLYKLGSLITGNSLYETRNFLGILFSEKLFSDVSNGPIKLLEMLAMKIDEPNSTLLRVISVGGVFFSLVVFYFIIANWQTHRIALISTVLYGFSSYLLQAGRFTSQDVLYLSAVPTLILIGTWLKFKRKLSRIMYGLPLVALFMYLPGMIIILSLLAIVFKTRLKLAYKYTNTKTRCYAAVGSLVVLLPMIYGLFKYPGQIPKILGIDQLTSGNLATVFEKLYQIPADILINGLSEPQTWLVGTPVIEVGSLAFLTLGVYSYYKGEHTLRFRLLGFLFLLSISLIAFGKQVSLSLLIPILYIFIANGAAFMLQTWFTVFPKNPAARKTAIIIFCLFIGLICSYHIQRSFIAWPNAPETKQALSVK